MENLLSSFRDEITSIRNYISFNLNLLNQKKLGIKRIKYLSSRKKKEFDYKSLIISIYGLLENYIERIIKEYLEILIKNISDYNSLNNNLKENHFTFSLKLANIINENKILKYKHLSKEEVINNLNNCISNTENYKINFEAFIIKSGNLKHIKICELFQGIGINLNNLLSQREKFKIDSENKFNQIDNLVSFRNEIAHGNPSDILSFSEIIPIIDFLEDYYSEIHSIIVNNLENFILEYQLKHNYTIISNITLYNGNIIGFNLNPIYLIENKGYLIIQNNNGIYSKEKILEKQEHSNNSCTLKIDRNLKKGFKYYCIKKH